MGENCLKLQHSTAKMRDSKECTGCVEMSWCPTILSLVVRKTRAWLVSRGCIWTCEHEHEHRSDSRRAYRSQTQQSWTELYNHEHSAECAGRGAQNGVGDPRNHQRGPNRSHIPATRLLGPHARDHPRTPTRHTTTGHPRRSTQLHRAVCCGIQWPMTTTDPRIRRT